MESNQNNSNNDTIDIRKEFSYYIFFWPWFVASVLLSIACAYLYLLFSNDIYQTKAAVQIKDDSDDPSSILTEGLGANLFKSNKASLYNEIAILNSNRIKTAVIKNLDLQTAVYEQVNFKNLLLWGNDIPFDIKFNAFEASNTPEAITLNFLKDIAQITFIDPNTDEKINEELAYGSSLKTNAFELTIPQSFPAEKRFTIFRSSLPKALKQTTNNLNIDVSSDEGDIIALSYSGVNRKKNAAILNMFIELLEADHLKDKRFVYEKTLSFINTRLEVLSGSIELMQDESVSFKSENKVFSPEIQTGNALSNIIKGEDQTFKLSIQFELTSSLKSELENMDAFDLLPANVGIDNQIINDLMANYNSLVLERDALLSNSTVNNPLVRQLSSQLTRFKSNILANVSNYLESLETSLARYEDLQQTIETEVSEIPSKESKLLNIARTFQITENLYMFLLERREETTINLESTLSNVKIVDNAYSSPTPIAPKTKIIYLGGMFLGFLLPFSVLFLRRTLDTKIHTREDVEEHTKIPIIGELPLINDTESISNPRSIIAESTRVVRANLSYMLNNQDKCSIIMLTSGLKGDGKTFVSFNLSCSLVASGKKVLLIGADLRNPQLHKFSKLSSKVWGLSDYLSSSADTTVEDLCIPYDYLGNQLDILYSGPIPPNPAELLINGRLRNLIESCVDKYDHIIFDTAPLMLVSDTNGILNFADLVIYNFRANKSDVREIDFLNTLSNNKDSINLSILINGAVLGPRSSNYYYGYEYTQSYD